MNVRRKGIDGERELAKILRSYGYDGRRGQQFSGANGDADVVGVPGLHIECKRVERLRLYDAIEQSCSDAREYEIPSVIHRRDKKEWLVTVRLEDFIKIYKAYEQERKES